MERINTDAPINLLVMPIEASLAQGGPVELLALGLAAWMRRMRGVDEAGEPIEIRYPLAERLMPLDRPPSEEIGSTDVGSVSWKVPTVQARGATHAVGTAGHSWQIVAQGKAGAAHKGLEHVAKVMAGTAVDAIRDPALVERAKAEFKERTGGKPYESPLPKDLAPPIKAMGQGV